MKKLFLLGVVLMAALVAQAQYRVGKVDNYHFVYVSASAGYSSMDENLEPVTTNGGFGGLVGVGYEFRRTHFWLSVGGQLSMMNSKSIVSDYQWDKSATNWPMKDGEKMYAMYPNGLKFDPVYFINQTDEQRLVSVDVPVMLGYYYSGFYVGVGAKAGFNFRSSIKTKGTYELAANIDRYSGELWRDKPDLYLTTYNYNGKRDYSPKVQASVIGEIGYDVLSTVRTHSTYCQVLKIGFYFECGVRSLAEDPSVTPLSFEEDGNGNLMAHQAYINPYYMSSTTSNDRILPYYVGVKVTYMFGGSRTNHSGTWHKGCQCYDN